MTDGQVTELRLLEEEILSIQHDQAALAMRLHDLHQRIIDLLLSELSRPLNA